MVEAVLAAVRELLAILDDAKENVDGGLHLSLCNAAQIVYAKAEALKEDEGEDEEEGEGEESDEEPERERTEDDMGVNELSELWGGNFDFGRPNAVLPLEGLIETIVLDDEHKRVCAAVRVLDRAVRGSKPDDPADAERILVWKEELIEQGAIKVCGEILQKVDDRGFHDQSHEEHWLYCTICSEISYLFESLGKNDALFRTKMRRNGALKGLEAYVRENPLGPGLPVLDMLKR